MCLVLSGRMVSSEMLNLVRNCLNLFVKLLYCCLVENAVDVPLKASDNCFNSSHVLWVFCSSSLDWTGMVRESVDFEQVKNEEWGWIDERGVQICWQSVLIRLGVFKNLHESKECMEFRIACVLLRVFDLIFWLWTKAAENNFTTPLKYCLSIWCILCFISTGSCCWYALFRVISMILRSRGVNINRVH